MEETAQKFQAIEESHVLRMKDIIRSYSRAVDETHVQIGEVHNEFVRNVENTSAESLIQKLAESKGTGKERPGPIEFEECNAAMAAEGAKARRRKPFGIPGRRKDKDTDSTESTEAESNAANGAPPGYYGAIDIQNANVPRVDDEGFCIRPESLENDAKENSFYSSSDSEDEEEPRKFHVEIKPAQPNDGAYHNRAAIDELKASVGNIVLSPPTSGQMRRNQSSDELAKARAPASYELSNNDLLSLDPLGPFLGAASSHLASAAWSASSPRGSPETPARARSAPVEPADRACDGALSSALGAPSGRRAASRASRFLSDDSAGPGFSDTFLWPSDGAAPVLLAPKRPSAPATAGALVPPPPRPSSRPKLPVGKLGGIAEITRPFSPAGASPPPAAPLARAESSSSLSSNASIGAANNPAVGTSRGPSPVTLASQDALPIAVAFTEAVNAYFKGADPAKCIAKITGDMTLSFPSGIVKVFTGNPSPAVLAFKLKNAGRLEQILPNQQLLFSDPSRGDSECKDFWFNMQALTAYLRKASEQNPAASYYNVDVLKYQVRSDGIRSTPLNLAVYWKCAADSTDVRVDYRYNPDSMAAPGPLGALQILVPVDGGVTGMQSLPVALWNAEQSKCLWKLSDISEKSENQGAGSLRAKFEVSAGPSKPSTLAVQFMGEGGTLSGVDMELRGAGYRLSLSKKRFATGRYMADC
ncbi:F-BAR domain only protein 2 isoform X3 [Hippocampus zosterae]|nr:F-BAR domain only protein 2 isoform X3 [Hippocampus zosterae]